MIKPFEMILDKYSLAASAGSSPIRTVIPPFSPIIHLFLMLLTNMTKAKDGGNNNFIKKNKKKRKINKTILKNKIKTLENNKELIYLLPSAMFKVTG